MVNYHGFDMTKQEIENDTFADFGTEMHGYVVYAVPTLYYQWGEHRQKGDSSGSVSAQASARRGSAAPYGFRPARSCTRPNTTWNRGSQFRTS